MEVLYEDNHLLVVNKSAGLTTQGAAAGEDSLVSRAKEYLKEKYRKPGNVYVGVVSRLDALVTGVVVLARTSKAAARLSEQFREAEVAKTYWAVVEGTPASHGTLVDCLVKDERQKKVIVVDRSHGQEARLQFRRLASLSPNQTLLEVKLETGRKHQIRVHLADKGHPIVGDKNYGSRLNPIRRLALHGAHLEFKHPASGKRMSFDSNYPKAFYVL